VRRRGTLLLVLALALMLGGCADAPATPQGGPRLSGAAPTSGAAPNPDVRATITRGDLQALPDTVPTRGAAPRPDTHTLATARLLSSAATTWPIAGGGNLFWVEKHGGAQAIYGYNVATQAQFTITAALRPDAGYGLLTDGQTLIWTESIVTDESAAPLYNIYGYDLRTQRPISLNIASAARTDAYSLALANGTLFYVDNTQAHYGLYAQDIFSGPERLISRCGGGPVATDRVLLWEEPEQGCSPPPPASDSENSSCCLVQEKGVLHLLKLDGSKGDTTVASSYGNLHYAVAGNKVVWSVYSVDQPIDNEGVYLYDIGSGSTTRLASQAGYDPLIGDNLVAWNNHPAEQSPAWTVTTYDIGTGTTSLAVKESATWSEAHAIVGSRQIAYTMTPLNGGGKIYLVSLP
jgi:hypothetical protein